jgi:hypothetical protein
LQENIRGSDWCRQLGREFATILTSGATLCYQESGGIKHLVRDRASDVQILSPRPLFFSHLPFLRAFPLSPWCAFYGCPKPRTVWQGLRRPRTCAWEAPNQATRKSPRQGNFSARITKVRLW